ncbi:hypothetical protein D3C76_165600 [compost metagenome]
MGLIVEVYRSARMGDCTNNGVSSRVDSLTLVNVSGPFEPSDNAPAAWLVPHRTMKGVVYIVCEDPVTSGKWPMAGGNYAATSDSRFSEAVQKLTGFPVWHGAVKIHDRYE